MIQKEKYNAKYAFDKSALYPFSAPSQLSGTILVFTLILLGVLLPLREINFRKESLRSRT